MPASDVLDTSGRPGTVVLVVRAWYQHDRFVARLIFEPGSPQGKGSVVVGSVDELCDALVQALGTLLPP